MKEIIISEVVYEVLNGMKLTSSEDFDSVIRRLLLTTDSTEGKA